MSDVIPPALDAALAHTGFVQGLARALLGADSAVDDVVQETWLAAARSGPDDPARMKGWLGGVVRRLSAGVYRKRATERRLAPGVTVKPDAPSTQEVVAREEMRREVVEGMLQLREPYRSALLLRYYEDLPPRAVAARLGIPVETARTRIKRGLEKLRRELDDRPGGRAAWMPAVGGLSGLAPGKAAGGVGAGLLAIAALVLVGLGVGLWWGLGGDDEEPPAPAADLADLTGAGGAGDAAGRGATLEGNAAGIVPGARAAPTGTAQVMGFIRRGGVPEARTVRLWHIGDFENDLDGRQQARRLEGVGLARAADQSADADARGRFAFEGLGVGMYVLGVEATGGALHTRLLSIAADGVVASGSLLLPSGDERLALHVTKADRSPFVGLVSLHRRDVEKGNAARTNLVAETDNSGRVTFEGLDSGAVWIEIIGEGTRTNATVVVPQSEVVKLVLGATTQVVDGRVLSHEGRMPIPEATIRVSSETPGPVGVRRRFENWSVRTDEKGEFRIGYTPGSESAKLVVTAPGHARLVHRTAEGKAAEPLTLLLHPETSITGLVRNATGAPVGGIVVTARRVEGHGGFRDLGWDLKEARSDRAGRYALGGLQAGTYVVYARGAGHASSEIGRARLGGFNPYLVEVPSMGLRDHHLTVARTTPSRGRVVDQHGKPIVGVHVQARLPFGRPREGPSPFLATSATVATDADGRFSINDLVPGLAWHAHLSGPHIVSAESVPLVLREATEPVTIVATRLDPGRDLVVRVVDEKDDSPIEGVHVRLRAPYDGGSMTISGVVGKTDEKGQATLSPVPSGPASVELMGRMIEAPRKATPVPKGEEERAEMTLRVPRRYVIRGTLALVPDGPPRFGFMANVTATAVDDADEDRVYGNVDSQSGAWSVGPLTKGKWRVSISMNQRKVSGVFDAGTEDARLELPYPWKKRKPASSATTKQPQSKPREFVEYKVLGPDGEAVPTIVAMTWGGGFQGGKKRPGAGWREGFNEHATAKALEVFDARTKRGDPLPFGAVVLPPAIRRGEVIIRMGPELTITGRVRIGGKSAPAGTPVTASATLLVDGEQRVSELAHARVITDAQGRFKMRGLGPYDYCVSVAGAGLLPSDKPTIIKAGANDVTLDFQAAVSPTITVLRENGSPLAGLRVRVLRDRRRASPFGDDVKRTDARGQVTFEGLDPGVEYYLDIGSAAKTHGVSGHAQSDWSPQDETIRLPAVRSVAGTVVDMQGTPMAGVRIQGNVPGRGKTYWAPYARTDEGGRFKIVDVPPGGVRIMAAGTYYRSDPLVAEPDDDRVVLRLERGVSFRVELGREPELSMKAAEFHWEATNGAGRRSRNSWVDKKQARTGVFSLPGQLIDATWQFFWRGLPGGRIGWLDGVQPREGETILVPLVEASTLTGRFDLPEGRTGSDLEVSVQVFGASWRVPVAEDGTFTIHGLPPAEVDLRPLRRLAPNSFRSGPDVTAAPGSTPVLEVPGS